MTGPAWDPAGIYAVGGDASDEQSAGVDAVRTQFGRAVDVPTGSGIYGFGPSNPIDVVSAEFEHAQACTLLFQAHKLVASGGPGPPPPDSLRLIVTSLLSGGASLVRTLPVQESIPRSIRLYGRSIQVVVVNAWPLTWRINAAIVEGDNAAPELLATWVASGAPASSGRIAALPGVLLKAQGFLAAAGSSTSYTLQFFDAADVPANGATPLLELGPLLPGGPAPFSLSDDSSPSIFFEAGLVWALSKTVGALTLADATARVDVGWGA